MTEFRFKPRGKALPPASPITAPSGRAPMRVSLSAAARLQAPKAQPESPYKLPTYPPGVVPKGATLAMDAAPDSSLSLAWGWANGYHGLWAEGIGFMGYPYLAELTQRPEYRVPSEVMAEEMTRKWITIKATSKSEKNEQVKDLTDAMKRFRLREVFRDATQYDGFFGLALIYIDVGTTDDRDELLKKLIIDPAKIKKGDLKGFKVIDPTWVAPNRYNSDDPLDPNFYKPETWFIMGKEVHSSRLIPIISRPVPDMLKPAYNFGGLSLSQMMKPYVDNWLSTRQSVNDLLQAFTTFVLKTNMEAVLSGAGGDDVDRRLAIFGALRNNRGLLTIDQETEALENISAPLGSLDHLQAQAQEHIAAPARIPLVKLFGITPSGLNASTDGEIRTFYDSIHGLQERVYGDPVTKCLQIIQLSEYGKIDDELLYEFNSLWELDEAGKAAVRKTDADTGAVLLTSSVITPDEERERIANDPHNPYHGLEGNAPEIEEPDEFDDVGEQEEPDGPKANGHDPASGIASSGARGATSGANSGV